MGDVMRDYFEEKGFSVFNYREFGKDTYMAIFSGHTDTLLIVDPHKSDISAIDLAKAKRNIFIYSKEKKPLETKNKVDSFFIGKEGELEKLIDSIK